MKTYINLNNLTSALLDMYDIENALKWSDFKNLPKDADGTEITIGDCIHDVIYFLEGLEDQVKKDQSC